MISRRASPDAAPRPGHRPKEDFSQKSAIFLQPKTQFDALVALPDSADRAKAVIDAMEPIEADYESLRGVLPKADEPAGGGMMFQSCRQVDESILTIGRQETCN